ncbi:hypothetical protein CISG_08653 [Coccidioides immitis RMSCC 3703]|uniref:Uncharacterized protein n=1 Tax=Coccidioides immitis RMSCC 3703 TaxID=454286 RepID=A0A0J8R6M0_COCIT|nr:hypothetical protein CISG_08653 [Coccidioides immitis RMSCC 3703]
MLGYFELKIPTFDTHECISTSLLYPLDLMVARAEKLSLRTPATQDERDRLITAWLGDPLPRSSSPARSGQCSITIGRLTTKLIHHNIRIRNHPHGRVGGVLRDGLFSPAKAYLHLFAWISTPLLDCLATEELKNVILSTTEMGQPSFPASNALIYLTYGAFLI